MVGWLWSSIGGGFRRNVTVDFGKNLSYIEVNAYKLDRCYHSLVF